MSRFFVFGIMLAACTPPAAELRSFERSSVAAALAGWRASGLADPSSRCDIDRTEVRVDSADRYKFDCGADPGFSAGCTNYGSDGSWFGGIEHPTVVIAPWWQSEPGIIVHELMHAFWRCSRMPGETGGGNSQHTDPRVWAAAGGATSVQARALAVLAAQTPPLLPK